MRLPVQLVFHTLSNLALRCSPRFATLAREKYNTIRTPFVRAHPHMSNMFTRELPEAEFIATRNYIMNINPP